MITTQMQIVPQAVVNPQYVVKPVALFNSAGDPVSSVENLSTMVITDYEIAGAGAALADTDTLNEALGKLEAQVAELAIDEVLLTGFVADDPAAVAATDTLLEALQKIQGSINDLTTRVETLEA